MTPRTAPPKQGEASLPPGYKLVRQDEYRPSGCPPKGSVWAIDSKTGAATTVFQREGDAVRAAWELKTRLDAMLLPHKAMNQAIYWQRIDHTDPRALEMADRHYSRRSPGTPEFVTAGHKVVLMHFDAAGAPAALWASHRADPAANLERPRFDGLDVWDCSLFRVERKTVGASVLIREAVAVTRGLWKPLPIDGFYTTIDPRKVPPIKRRGALLWGYSYLKAGWMEQAQRTGRGYIVYTLPLAALAATEPLTTSVNVPPFGTSWRRWRRPVDEQQTALF